MMDSFLKNIRATTWRVLALAIVVCVGMSVLQNFVVGSGGGSVREALGVVEQATGGPYILTQNLFVCVGLHSLWNQPARLLQVPFEHGVAIVWFMLTAILVLTWLPVRRWWDRSAGDTSARPQ